MIAILASAIMESNESYKYTGLGSEKLPSKWRPRNFVDAINHFIERVDTMRFSIAASW